MWSMNQIGWIFNNRSHFKFYILHTLITLMCPFIVSLVYAKKAAQLGKISWIPIKIVVTRNVIHFHTLHSHSPLSISHLLTCSTRWTAWNSTLGRKCERIEFREHGSARTFSLSSQLSVGNEKMASHVQLVERQNRRMAAVDLKGTCRKRILQSSKLFNICESTQFHNWNKSDM